MMAEGLGFVRGIACSSEIGTSAVSLSRTRCFSLRPQVFSLTREVLLLLAYERDFELIQRGNTGQGHQLFILLPAVDT